MSVSGVSNSAALANALNSPGARFSRIQRSALSSLWDGASGKPSDLNSFAPAAAAMPMYQRPGLLTGLTKWDGGMTPGSQRTPRAAAPAAPKALVYAFNPFDRASWWTDPKGSTVDKLA